MCLSRTTPLYSRSLLPPHIPHGIHVDSMWIPPSIWNPHGMVMECPNSTWNDGMSRWIPHGMRMDSIWIPHGLHPFHMDSTWTASIPHGFHVDSTWIPHGIRIHIKNARNYYIEY